MNIIRKSITLLAAIAIPVLMFGQYKVEEASDRRIPGWVNSVERGYLIVSEKADDIETARNMVLQKLKAQIAQSVATKIVSETELQQSYTQSNGTYSIDKNLESSIATKTANLPFISSITLSKAEDSYWEKRYFKKEKSYEYFFAVKYPFSDTELARLIDEYQEHESKLNSRIAKLETGLDMIESIEDIDRAIADARTLLTEFTEEDPRYAKVQSLSSTYRSLYKNITINYTQKKKGEISVTLELGGKTIVTGRKPVLKSNCATAITASYDGSIMIVRYNDEGCYDEDENYIEIRFNAGNNSITERMYFRSSVNISLTGIVSDEYGRPVPYAKLTLVPSGKTSVSGRNGVYTYNDIAAGDYNMQVMKRGYYTETLPVYVVDGNTITTDVTLREDGSLKAGPAAGTAAAPMQEEPAPGDPAPAAAEPRKDPLNTVRAGLAAYFRFNGNTSNELDPYFIGVPVNSPTFTDDSKDGTQAVSLNSINESQLSFPKAIISFPMSSFSVTFWAKGISDGHIWSCTNGDNNMPSLVMKDGRLAIGMQLSGSVNSFTHPAIDQEWHFIAVTLSKEGHKYFAKLYLDGFLVDAISTYSPPSFNPTKFLLGGASKYMNAIGMTVDNLRIYNARELSDKEIRMIYESEL